MSGKSRSGGRFPAASSGRKAAMEQARLQRKKRLVILCAAGGVFLAAMLALALTASGVFAGRTAAVTVGGSRVSAAVYNCYYSKARVEMASMFSMTGGAGLDGYRDPQTGASGRDIVMEQAEAAIQRDYAAVAEARAAGWTLDAAGLAKVAEEIALVTDMAESDGYATVDRYLAATVGAGCDLDSYREYTETVQWAQGYRDAYRAGLTFGQSEIQAAYDASPELFDMVSFLSFYYEGADKTKAESAAATVTDEASFAAMARLHAGKGQEPVSGDTLRKNMLVSRLNEGNRHWLTDSGRAYGDVGVTAYRDAGCFILFYIGKNQDRAARDQAVEDDLREKAFARWSAGLTEKYPLKRRWLGMAAVAQ